MLAVNKKCRKAGIGSHLVQLAVERMRKLDCDEVGAEGLGSLVIAVLTRFCGSSVGMFRVHAIGDAGDGAQQHQRPAIVRATRLHAQRKAPEILPESQRCIPTEAVVQVTLETQSPY